MTDFIGIDLSPGSSGLVALDGDETVRFWRHFHEENIKVDMLSRFGMANSIMTALWMSTKERPKMVAIEDYDLRGQQTVGYQIAEVAGIVKYKLLDIGWPIVLIHPSKRSSFIIRKRLKSKEVKLEAVRQAVEAGFSELGEIKKPGGKGLYQREKEDLADAWVIARMGKVAYEYLQNGVSAVKGDIFCDPDHGLMNLKNVFFNIPGLESGIELK